MDGDRRPNSARADRYYCSNCGKGLEPSTNYCPNCGASADRPDGASRPSFDGRYRPSTGSPSPQEQSTDRSSLGYRIAAATTDGWSLERDYGDHVVMVRRTVGSVSDHAAIALVTGWWTMGVGNVLYGIYRYANDAERLVLGADDRTTPRTEEPTHSAPYSWVIAAVCWLTAAILVGAAVQTAAVGALILGILALFVGFAGTSRLPSVRRRLERRHPVTANGRVRTVDERAVRSPAEPCTACAAPIEQGLERTYRTDDCVLGVPVTSSARRNHYCRSCANAETAPVAPTASLETNDRSESADRSRPSNVGRRSAIRDGTASKTDREPEPR